MAGDERDGDERDGDERDDDLGARLRATDPATGLRAVGALRRLAERVEMVHVAQARRAGWSWEQIGDALGVTKQSAHAKHGKASDVRTVQ
jgi:hypothetical protein